jgi:uncharacterized protein GlcG (DUF336 family)
MLIFVVAFGVSFLPADRHAQAQTAHDAFTLTIAERAVDAGNGLAQREGARVAFVILAADGRLVVATEMTGTKPAARAQASRRAECLLTSIHSAARSRTSLASVNSCGITRAARVLRRGNIPVAVFAVSGAGDPADERVLGAAFAAARP